MKKETHAFKLPRAGWKGQLTTYDAYSIDLEFLRIFLMDQGIAFEDMTVSNWEEYVDYRKQGPKKSFGFSAQGRSLSAARRLLGHLCIPKGEHPIWEVEWPEGVRKPPRIMTMGKREKLLVWAEGTYTPERNKALILLISNVGGRRFEIADALWERMDLEERTVWLLTKADDLKPRQWELKTFSPAAARALRAWKKIAPQDPRIFGLTKEGVSSLWKRAGANVGFKVSSHDFRRGLGKFMADNGVSDRVGMLVMGIRTHSVYLDYAEGAEPKLVMDSIWGEDG